MPVFTLLLVFIMNGQLVVEQKDFDTEVACNQAGEKRVEQQMKDPHFDAGLFGACIPNIKQKV